jgi:hypothetical protein
MAEELKDAEESKEEPCLHNEIIWTSYTGGDEVIECALCGKELKHWHEGDELNVEITLEE